MNFGNVCGRNGNVHNLSGLPLARLVFRHAHRAVHNHWRLMHFWHPVAQRGFILFTSLPMHTQGSMLKTQAMMILAILEVLLHLGRVRQLLQKQVVQKTQHLRELSDDVTSHWLLLVRLLGSDAQ